MDQKIKRKKDKMEEIKWDASDTGKIVIYSGNMVDKEFPRSPSVPGVYHVGAIDQVLLFEGEYVEINVARLQASLRYRGIKEDSDEWHEAMDMQAHEPPGIWLYGDWICNNQFIFEPDFDTPKGFSATYDADNGYMVVEKSELVTICRKTSPCFVIHRDGKDRLCGDVVSQEDGNVWAFCLPKEWHTGFGA